MTTEYYITITKEGRFNGLISTVHDITRYEIKKKVSKKIFDIFTNKFYGYLDFNPIINIELIDTFINDETLDKLNVEEIINKYIIADKIEFEIIFTEEQKDIKFLAETLKSFIEPMALPSDRQSNPSLVRLQEIINRYSS